MIIIEAVDYLLWCKMPNGQLKQIISVCLSVCISNSVTYVTMITALHVLMLVSYRVSTQCNPDIENVFVCLVGVIINCLNYQKSVNYPIILLFSYVNHQIK